MVWLAFRCSLNHNIVPTVSWSNARLCPSTASHRQWQQHLCRRLLSGASPARKAQLSVYCTLSEKKRVCRERASSIFLDRMHVKTFESVQLFHIWNIPQLMDFNIFSWRALALLSILLPDFPACAGNFWRCQCCALTCAFRLAIPLY